MSYGYFGERTDRPARQPDWTCHHCAARCFGNRDNCFKCGADKDGALPALQFGEVPIGDWFCPKCDTIVWANRDQCFRCKFLRTKEVELVPPGFKGAKGGGRGSRFAEQAVAVDDEKDRVHDPGAAFGPLGAARNAPGTNTGDWRCKACSMPNFAVRTVCFSCAKPRDDFNVEEWAKQMKENVRMQIESQPAWLDFYPSATFVGARPKYKFQMGPKGVGYYADRVTGWQSPEEVKKEKEAFIVVVAPSGGVRVERDAGARKCRLRVTEDKKAGLDLDHCQFGFRVAAIDDHPGQPELTVGDCITEISGRNLQGLSEEQTYASFLKRLENDAVLLVAPLESLDDAYQQALDADILEGFSPEHQRPWYFNRRTKTSHWTRKEAREAKAQQEQMAAIDIGEFLRRGGLKDKDLKKKKKKKDVPTTEAEAAEKVKDLRERQKEWNDGGIGGYTAMLFQKYQPAAKRARNVSFFNAYGEGTE